MSFVFSVPAMLRLAVLALALSGPALAQNATVDGGSMTRSTTFPTSSTPSTLSTSSSSEEGTTTIRRTSTSTMFTTITPSPSSTITAGPNCTLSCGIGASLTRWDWFRQPFDTTITAATKIIIINDDTNTTRTSLIFNDLPSGYTLPPMNDEGTQIWSMSYTLPGQSTPTTSVLTFPTVFVQYPLGYTWDGVFPTTGADGQPSCLTGDGKTLFSYGSYSTKPQPTPDATRIGDNGLNWSSMRIVYPETAYKEVLPNDPILNGCNLMSGVAPVAANPTASFLTEVITSHESGAAPPDTPTPAPTPTQTAAPPPPPPPPPEPTGTTPPPAPAPQPNDPASPPAPAPAPINTQVPAPEPANPLPAPGDTQAPPPPPAGTATQLPQVTGTTAAAANPPPAQGATTPGIQTVINGQTTTVPAAATPGIQTVINGQTTTIPAAPNAPAPASPPAPPIVVVGETFTPVTTASGAAPVFNVGGQTLGVGSTITLSSGSVAETVALQTNNAGSTVLVVGSSSSTLPPPPPASTTGLGDIIIDGLGGTSTVSTSSRASSSGPAEQTTNPAPRIVPGCFISLAAGVMFALSWT